jgi:hypothetical protein
MEVKILSRIFQRFVARKWYQLIYRSNLSGGSLQHKFFYPTPGGLCQRCYRQSGIKKLMLCLAAKRVFEDVGAARDAQFSARHRSILALIRESLPVEVGAGVATKPTPPPALSGSKKLIQPAVPTGKIYQQDAMWLSEMDLKYDIFNSSPLSSRLTRNLTGYFLF